MCIESFGDVRFDLGALLEVQMWSLIPIMVYISLIMDHRGLDQFVQLGWLLVSDLTLDPSFKFKCGSSYL